MASAAPPSSSRTQATYAFSPEQLTDYFASHEKMELVACQVFSVMRCDPLLIEGLMCGLKYKAIRQLFPAEMGILRAICNAILGPIEKELANITPPYVDCSVDREACGFSLIFPGKDPSVSISTVKKGVYSLALEANPIGGQIHTKRKSLFTSLIERGISRVFVESGAQLVFEDLRECETEIFRTGEESALWDVAFGLMVPPGYTMTYQKKMENVCEIGTLLPIDDSEDRNYGFIVSFGSRSELSLAPNYAFRCGDDFRRFLHMNHGVLQLPPATTLKISDPELPRIMQELRKFASHDYFSYLAALLSQFLLSQAQTVVFTTRSPDELFYRMNEEKKSVEICAEGGLLFMQGLEDVVTTASGLKRAMLISQQQRVSLAAGRRIVFYDAPGEDGIETLPESEDVVAITGSLFQHLCSIGLNWEVRAEGDVKMRCVEFRRPDLPMASPKCMLFEVEKGSLTFSLEPTEPEQFIGRLVHSSHPDLAQQLRDGSVEAMKLLLFNAIGYHVWGEGSQFSPAQAYFRPQTYKMMGRVQTDPAYIEHPGLARDHLEGLGRLCQKMRAEEFAALQIGPLSQEQRDLLLKIKAILFRESARGPFITHLRNWIASSNQEQRPIGTR